MNTITQRISNHLKDLWDKNPDLTLEYVEAWSKEKGHPISRQAVSRALNQKVKRMQSSTAEMFALFIEEHTEHCILAKDLLDVDKRSPEEHLSHLLQKANQNLSLTTWQESVQACIEALGIAQSLEDKEIISEINAKIADIHLLYTDAHGVAQGYYETALQWATNDEQRSLLLCRLAYCNQSTRWFAHYLRDVQRLPETPSLKVWITYLQALEARRASKFAKARELAERVIQDPKDLPQDILIDTYTLLLGLAGIHRDTKAVQHLAKQLPKETAETIASIKLRHALHSAYFEAGKMAKTVEVLHPLIKIYKTTYRTQDLAHILGRIGYCQLSMADIAKARESFRKSLQHFPNAWSIYFYLTKSWIHDEAKAGMDWAEGLLRCVEQEIFDNARKGTPTDAPSRIGYPVGKLAQRLGVAERIYQNHNAHNAFKETVQSWNTELLQRGFTTNIKWYVEETCDLEELPECKTNLAFDAGTLEGVWDACKKTLTCRPLPKEGAFKAPSFTTQVSGDFALQITTDGGEKIIQDLIKSRLAAQKERICPLAAGSAALFARLDGNHSIRLVAHIQSPGEILCEESIDGTNHTIGRGILQDGPIRLRMERKGGLLQTFAADETGPWYRVSQIACSDQPITIGWNGQAIVDLYHIARRCAVQVWDVRFGH